MNFEQIYLDETHIRLTTDIDGHDLGDYIYSLRRDLKNHILRNNDFLVSLEPLEMPDEELPPILFKMYESSDFADVGPMACVAGTISEMSLDYLINQGSSYSIVENGGDIAIVNDKKLLCGIYSNNEILGNSIKSAINTILMIGGFVVLFSVIISILNSSKTVNLINLVFTPICKKYNIPSQLMNSVFTGILEITNGINLISCINLKNISINIIVTSFLLGFGGLSVLLQVLSIVSKSDLSIKPYIIGKILHGFISAFYTFIILNFHLGTVLF